MLFSRPELNSRLISYIFAIAIVFSSSSLAFLAPETPMPSPPKNCQTALVMEVSSGKILFEHNIHDRVYPASMAKMMLILITMEKVKSEEISLDDVITVSAAASKIGGSQVYLKHNETFTLQELLESVLIQSANDSSHLIAEYIAGSRDAFVELMNHRATQLGLENTVYQSPHGLPPDAHRDPDITTAYDLALIARQIVIEHPEVLLWSSVDTKPFRDGTFIMTNTNRLVRSFEGCDGLKTGYYREAGFSITVTAEQKGVRVIAVVTGCDKGKERFEEAERLMKWGLSLFISTELITAGFPAENSIPVINGVKLETYPVAQNEVKAVIPRNRVNDIIMKTTLERELVAPLEPGILCGTIRFFLDDHELGASDLITTETIEALGWWGRMKRKVGL